MLTRRTIQLVTTRITKIKAMRMGREQFNFFAPRLAFLN